MQYNLQENERLRVYGGQTTLCTPNSLNLSVKVWWILSTLMIVLECNFKVTLSILFAKAQKWLLWLLYDWLSLQSWLESCCNPQTPTFEMQRLISLVTVSITLVMELILSLLAWDISSVFLNLLCFVFDIQACLTVRKCIFHKSYFFLIVNSRFESTSTEALHLIYFCYLNV